MFDHIPGVVNEISASIDRATRARRGVPPTEVLVGEADWRAICRMRPEWADPDWHLRIRGIPVRRDYLGQPSCR